MTKLVLELDSMLILFALENNELPAGRTERVSKADSHYLPSNACAALNRNPFKKGGMMKKKVLQPDRIRKINGSFAFIEHRFLRAGFFETLSHNELLLYLFLTLVANKDGISWYPYDKICAILKWILDEYLEARNGLISKNLIAFDGHVFQVLDLPHQPQQQESKLLKTDQDFQQNDPATIQNLIRISWAKKI